MSYSSHSIDTMTGESDLTSCTQSAPTTSIDDPLCYVNERRETQISHRSIMDAAGGCQSPIEGGVIAVFGAGTLKSSSGLLRILSIPPSACLGHLPKYYCTSRPETAEREGGD